MKTDQVPALPMTVEIKNGKLIIQYGKYNCKFKPIEPGVYPGLLVTKFVWQVTKELWGAHYDRQRDISDVKKSLLGTADEQADMIVRQIHDELFGAGENK